jgi:hypothetical protein
MKHNINLLVSRYYDMEGDLCEQCPFFYSFSFIILFVCMLLRLGISIAKPHLISGVFYWVLIV